MPPCLHSPLPHAALPPAPPAAPPVDPDTSNGTTVTISNSHLSLTFNASSGLLLEAGATNGTPWRLPLQHSLLWYHGSNGQDEPSSPGLGSGAYIFRLAPGTTVRSRPPPVSSTPPLFCPCVPCPPPAYHA